MIKNSNATVSVTFGEKSRLVEFGHPKCVSIRRLRFRITFWRVWNGWSARWTALVCRRRQVYVLDADKAKQLWAKSEALISVT